MVISAEWRYSALASGIVGYDKNYGTRVSTGKCVFTFGTENRKAAGLRQRWYDTKWLKWTSCNWKGRTHFFPRVFFRLQVAPRSTQPHLSGSRLVFPVFRDPESSANCVTGVVHLRVSRRTRTRRVALPEKAIRYQSSRNWYCNDRAYDDREACRVYIQNFYRIWRIRDGSDDERRDIRKKARDSCTQQTKHASLSLEEMFCCSATTIPNVTAKMYHCLLYLLETCLSRVKFICNILAVAEGKFRSCYQFSIKIVVGLNLSGCHRKIFLLNWTSSLGRNSASVTYID